jgi:hypothetical protein
MKVFDFCLSWSLASVKSMWFTTFMSESIVWFKRQENQSDFKKKNTISDGMKMFRKYQLAVWWSIQNFYLHFTKVSRKCECFSHIVEPWWLLLTRKLLKQGFLLVKLKSSLLKFYGRHHDLVDGYGISVSQMTMDMFHLS